MREKRPRWYACIDCGIEKVNGQTIRPRCMSCAIKHAHTDPVKGSNYKSGIEKKRINPKWDSCIVCGVEKIGDQRRSSKCHKCACADVNVRERQSAIMKVNMNRPETKEKCSISQKKIQKDIQNRDYIRIRKSITRGGDGDLRRIDAQRKERKANYRYSEEYKWSSTVKERDGYQCQHCGQTERSLLHAHHIKQRAAYPELRYDLNNGLTLCQTCHIKEHRRLREISQVS
jgi:5-methylcytosine-specific restriction endonuclease McrA